MVHVESQAAAAVVVVAATHVPQLSSDLFLQDTITVISHESGFRAVVEFLLIEQEEECYSITTKFCTFHLFACRV